MTGTLPDIWKKSQRSSSAQKREETNQVKTTGLYRFFLFVGKYLKR